MQNTLSTLGYQILPKLLSTEQLTSLQTLSYELKEQPSEKRKNVFSISQAVEIHFQEIAAKLNAEGISCTITPYCFYLEKTADSNWPLQFHQDTNLPDYLNLDENMLENWLASGFWVRVNLDNNDADTGAIKVIPGSHLVGKHGPFDKEKAIFLPVAAGDAVLFSPLLYHGSDKMKMAWERRVFQCFFLRN